MLPVSTDSMEALFMHTDLQMLEISIKKASPAVSRKIGDCPIA